MSNRTTVRIAADTESGFIAINATEFDPNIHELFGLEGKRETERHVVASGYTHVRKWIEEASSLPGADPLRALADGSEGEPAVQ